MLAAATRTQPTRAAAAPRHRAQCYRCFKPAATCICSTVTRVANRTGILILQHPRERLHAIGTVRFARLGLSHVRVRSCAPGMDSSTPLPPRTAVPVVANSRVLDLAPSNSWKQTLEQPDTQQRLGANPPILGWRPDAGERRAG